MRIDVGVSQWQGRRKSQQDRCKAIRLHDGVSAVLCDGMGGAAGGEVAAEIVCEEFSLVNFDDKDYETVWLQAVARANNGLRNRIKISPELEGMGTTVVTVRLDASGLKWLSIGDSPLWLYREGDLRQLNLDESYGGYLDRKVSTGEIELAEALHHPKRHQLMNVLMGQRDVHVEDLSSEYLTLKQGDLVLLASDGLQTMADDKIKQIINHVKTRDVNDIVRQLMIGVSAERHPRQDNCSVMLFKITKEENDL